ncbi:transmembrane protein, putative (macronuclear) [Tetrahymena thermophila SB210]|uniref:Transmembrane protein, putative n=1 Tax=Tetrahymena thermophila (strain SB210) TaxID=312017 RepID=W7XBI5_TETTS|nr:transmembrane protein, putative [Tetrahymena thermophila SB210]EWS73778.1 transmembrane protein, putative [Tetrahymena thermophila SB210]|eukprot:XP_012653658.1 transmembrane protein, putative [Tetrahymena thermophila SB210]
MLIGVVHAKNQLQFCKSMLKNLMTSLTQLKLTLIITQILLVILESAPFLLCFWFIKDNLLTNFQAQMKKSLRNLLKKLRNFQKKSEQIIQQNKQIFFLKNQQHIKNVFKIINEYIIYVIFMVKIIINYFHSYNKHFCSLILNYLLKYHLIFVQLHTYYIKKFQNIDKCQIRTNVTFIISPTFQNIFMLINCLLNQNLISKQGKQKYITLTYY